MIPNFRAIALIPREDFKFGDMVYSCNYKLSEFWSLVERGILDISTLGHSLNIRSKDGREIYSGDILGGMWENIALVFCQECRNIEAHIYLDKVMYDCLACEGDVHWYDIVEDKNIEVVGDIFTEIG